MSRQAFDMFRGRLSERGVERGLADFDASRSFANRETPGRQATWPHSFALLHVIAWEIERTADGVHIVTPLTIDGNPDRCSNKWLIKTPDGTYIMQEETEFETEEQALNYCRHWVEGEREEARKMRHNAPKRAATFFRNLNRRWSSPKQERSM